VVVIHSILIIYTRFFFEIQAFELVTPIFTIISKIPLVSYFRSGSWKRWLFWGLCGWV